MNPERGVRRITLVVSVVAALCAGVSSSPALYDHWYWERENYLAYKDKYENLKWFWETWDADAWTRDGNSTTKNDVLRALLGSPWYGMPFTRQIDPELDFRTEFTLSGRDAVPGMDAAMLNLPAVALAPVVQKAREKGLSTAFANCRSEETLWTQRTELQLLAFSIIFGLVPGIGAFIAVWLLFLLFRWIVRGFYTPTDAVPVQAIPRERKVFRGIRLCLRTRIYPWLRIKHRAVVGSLVGVVMGALAIYLVVVLAMPDHGQEDVLNPNRVYTTAELVNRGFVAEEPNVLDLVYAPVVSRSEKP